MTTKELIKALQKLDPSGEMEVVDRNNNQIFFAEKVHSSMEGPKMVINEECEMTESYNKDDELVGFTKIMPDLINKVKITDRGKKIVLAAPTLEELMASSRDLKIDIDVIEGLNEIVKEKVLEEKRKSDRDWELFDAMFGKI